MNLISVFKTKTMSSREIASATGKGHGHVMRDIRVLRDQLGDMFVGSIRSWTHPQNGQEYEEFLLDKDTCFTLMLGYDAVARMKLVKRWQQLEESSGHLIPDFSNPAEAARAWAIQYEEKTKAIAIAEEAIRTKAEIGSKREASAMATASAKSKEVSRLQIELDKSSEYATVKRMEMAYHGQRFNWRLLKSASQDLGIPAREVFDANYGTVKSYHADAWREAYALDII